RTLRRSAAVGSINAMKSVHKRTTLQAIHTSDRYCQPVIRKPVRVPMAASSRTTPSLSLRIDGILPPSDTHVKVIAQTSRPRAALCHDSVTEGAGARTCAFLELD